MSKKDKTRAAGPSADAEAPAPPFGLKLLVFTGGAVLMGLEMAGSRVLAPHFGNSVFVWGSIISVFLIALSAGYYVGGRLADRMPSFAFLNGICLLAGLLILVVPYFAHGLCSSLVEGGWGEESGPLVATAILFLPASFFLGTLSPFSVRLAAQTVQTVGAAAGTLYSLSTVGSIAGTLVTTFVLIPHFGVTGILRGLGVAMIVVPFAMLLTRPKKAAPASPLAALGVLLAVLPAPGSITLTPGAQMVLEEETPYHHIAVIDYGRGKATVDAEVKGAVRALRFDRFTESSIELEKPYRSQAKYTDYFHLAFLANPRIARTVFIGAGGGVGPRTFSEMDPSMAIDVVDIDRRILEVAHTYFHMPTGGRVTTHAEDGRRWLHNEKGTCDCLILDAFTIGGVIPFHLTTREFFEDCARRLSDDGVLIMNVNSALEGEKGGIFLRVMRTLDAVFPQLYVFSKELHDAEDTYKDDRTVSRNEMVVAMKRKGEALSLEDWRRRVFDDYHEGSYLEKKDLYRMVRDLDLEWRAKIGDVPILTDDFAPIETLGF